MRNYIIKNLDTETRDYLASLLAEVTDRIGELSTKWCDEEATTDDFEELYGLIKMCAGTEDKAATRSAIYDVFNVTYEGNNPDLWEYERSIPLYSVEQRRRFRDITLKAITEEIDILRESAEK